MNTLLSAASVAVGLLLAANATAAPQAASPCFRTSEMRNHTVADAKTLYVGVGAREVYRLRMSGNCLAGAHSSDPLVIATTGSTGLVCRPLDLDLGINRGGTNGFTSHCIVDSITRLTPAETALLPKKLKP